MRDVPYSFALEVDESDAILINIGNCQFSTIINPTHIVVRVIRNVMK
jgi:hypothetical protein